MLLPQTENGQDNVSENSSPESQPRVSTRSKSIQSQKQASKTLSLATIKTADKENLLNGQQTKRNPAQGKKLGAKKTFGMIERNSSLSFGKAERVPLGEATTSNDVLIENVEGTEENEKEMNDEIKLQLETTEQEQLRQQEQRQQELQLREEQEQRIQRQQEQQLLQQQELQRQQEQQLQQRLQQQQQEQLLQQQQQEQHQRQQLLQLQKQQEQQRLQQQQEQLQKQQEQQRLQRQQQEQLLQQQQQQEQHQKQQQLLQQQRQQQLLQQKQLQQQQLQQQQQKQQQQQQTQHNTNVNINTNANQVKQVPTQKSTLQRQITPQMRVYPQVNLPPQKTLPQPNEILQFHSFQLPSWTNTTVVVNGRPYIKLSRIGKGGSSVVYKVLSEDGNIYAVKKVSLVDADASTRKSFLDEIDLLKRLQTYERIIKLIDYQYEENAEFLHIILEFAEIDLARTLEEFKGRLFPNHMNYLRIYWQEMLEAVFVVHSENERIVHGDIKPQNFVFVKGHIKLIDFGIAKAIDGAHTTNIQRDNIIGTINYMAPETLKSKYGRASDVWALGCIFYQMVFGKPPFQLLNYQPIQILQCLSDPNYEISYPNLEIEIPKLILDVLQHSLKKDPTKRATTEELLKHPFLNQL